MVNYDILFAIVFYAIILIIFFKYRSKFDVQGKIFIMYRTKLGLRLMDYLSKKIPRLLKIFSFLGIIVGFGGMIYISYFVIRYTLKFILIPGTEPVLSPVLPGVHIPGAPPLSFWHWIISILILAVIHEFSHGVIARLYNVKVKSSGFAFLGPILAAFVEPDEKELIKKPKKVQLEMFAAGPFSNILLAGIILLFLSYVFSPYIDETVQVKGLRVIGFEKEFSTEDLKKGDIILGVNNLDLVNKKLNVFFNEIKNKTNQEITLKVKSAEDLTKTIALKVLPSKDDPKLGKLGVLVRGIYDTKDKILIWFWLLTVWLFITNLGVGLFNLLPLGPVDGGRMFTTAVSYVIKDPNKARKLTNLVSLILLALIVVNLLPFLYKLLIFIITPVINLI